MSDPQTLHTLSFSAAEVVNLLAYLEHAAVGDYVPHHTAVIKADIAGLAAKVTEQTGLSLSDYKPRDMTEAAAALKQRCTRHVLSISGRCLVCGAAVQL